jgi:hypothetical protein
MMKKLYVKLMTAALAVVILTGCGQKAGYMSALPGQSVVVAKVNVGNLLDESEVLSDNQVKGALKEIINETQGETRTLLREITQDPRTCGIDIDNPVFAAICEQFQEIFEDEDDCFHVFVDGENVHIDLEEGYSSVPHSLEDLVECLIEVMMGWDEFDPNDYEDHEPDEGLAVFVGLLTFLVDECGVAHEVIVECP